MNSTVASLPTRSASASVDDLQLLEQQKQQLRRQMRRLRRSLSAQQQRHAARSLVRRMAAHPTFISSKHLALYLSNDGEIDPRPLIHKAWSMHKHVYLPVLHPLNAHRMLFQHYTADTPMVRNRFGIEEPRFDVSAQRPAWTLDLICMPLVAFDASGNRLGMGGGFYDRAFAFLHRGYLSTRMVGLAHQGQEVPQLPVASWDIPLQGIMTDGGWCPASGTEGHR
ncbi:5-formyltetrahydrofolate cyclo-ligase [Pokkaliibacter sp. MBI-7]|uniref:5-formyltetrahydrofolate cyclo-ligase n=1 Tax=Pokkaliibacter sp. MBI-7 TaxID=3040600 RepID=UPI00244D74B6|nr:5-formyltetrahydrofolate cyclo-ligase [Pokkaliibacter sp. MBI-7]MDH2432300.1 5-formyltetrahydrofolate cyclo-ligase [Pokkaliibacter sp. MBI-7]